MNEAESDLQLEIAHLSQKSRNHLVLFVVLVMALVASLPFMVTYSPSGDDLQFHLIRIEGIAAGLKSLQFPVRMQYVQLGGYGYPVSIMYGDLFLYFPAVLTLIGFPTTVAYNLYAVFINILTAYVSYYVFKEFTKSCTTGAALCGLWVLAPYRLTDLWVRAAVGEYTALLFYPVVFYGLYLIYAKAQLQQVKLHANSYGYIWLAVGGVGVIISHIISVVVLSLLLVPIIIAGGGRAFRPRSALLLSSSLLRPGCFAFV